MITTAGKNIGRHDHSIVHSKPPLPRSLETSHLGRRSSTSEWMKYEHLIAVRQDPSITVTMRIDGGDQNTDATDQDRAADENDDSDVDQTAPSIGKQSQWQRRQKKYIQTDMPFEEVLVFAAIADIEPNPTTAIASDAVELTKTDLRRN